MAGIARGSIIGGRYVVSAIQHPWIEEDASLGDVCSAVDGILDRPVTLYTSDRESGADIPDAARRVALIAEPHIPSILDVGTENDLVYVVTEETGGRTLAEILSFGPLNPEQARAVVGETAEALAASATRGIYHGRLTPSSIDVDAKGGVHVRGVGIDAAAAPGEALEGKEARHTDALSLVSVLYAACTAHWPAPEGAAGLPAAPTDAQGNIEPPGEVTPGIPNDLDSLAAAVFASNDDGPRSAAEVAGYLRPWQTDELASLFTRGAPAPEPAAPPADDPARTDGDDLVLTRPIPVSSETPAPGADAPHQPQFGAAIRRATTRPGAAGLAAGVAASPSAQAPDPIAEALAMRSPSRFPLAASSAAPSPAPAPPRPATPRTAVPASAQATNAPAATPAAPESEASGPKGGASVAGASLAGAAAAAPISPAGRTPGAPKTGAPAPRGPQARPGPAAPAPAAFPAAAAGSAPTVAIPAAAAYAPPGATPPAGAPPASTPPPGGQPPAKRGNAGRIGAIVVAAVVVLGIVFAIVNLSRIGKDDDPVAAPPAATSQAAKPSPSQKPKPGPQPVVAKAISIDPEGDGDEYPELTKNVLVGEKGAWNTQTYKSAEFGGLKTGLGLALQLEEPAQVSGIDLKFAGKNLKGKFDVRASDDGKFKGSTSIKKANIDDGTVEVRFDKPVKTEYIILWFTELPRFSDGYRVELSEAEPIGVK